MKPLNFKKLFCVLLSASILAPSVANADSPSNRDVVPPPSRNSSKSSEFMKNNWPYFVAGIPGVAVIGGIIWYFTANSGNRASAQDQPDHGAAVRSEANWNACIAEFTKQGKLPGATVCTIKGGTFANFQTRADYYFFEITSYRLFTEYLECRCGLDEKNQQKIVSYANKILYANDVQNIYGNDYQFNISNLFGSYAGLFCQDLLSATEHLKTVTESDNIQVYRADDIQSLNDFNQKVCADIAGHIAGYAVLTENALCNKFPYWRRGMDGTIQNNILSDHVERQGASPLPTGNLFSRVTAVATTAVNLCNRGVAADTSDTDGKEDVSTSAAPVAPKSIDAKDWTVMIQQQNMEGNESGIFFGRFGPEVKQNVKIGDVSIPGTGVAMNAYQRLSTTDNSTRHCYFVYDIDKFLGWCLKQCRELSQKFDNFDNVKALARKILMNQNRFISDATSIANSGDRWCVTTAFSKTDGSSCYNAAHDWLSTLDDRADKESLTGWTADVWNGGARPVWGSCVYSNDAFKQFLRQRFGVSDKIIDDNACFAAMTQNDNRTGTDRYELKDIVKLYGITDLDAKLAELDSGLQYHGEIKREDAAEVTVFDTPKIMESYHPSFNTDGMQAPLFPNAETATTTTTTTTTPPKTEIN